MQENNNLIIVLAGAGVLIAILLVFGIMGARSNPVSVNDAHNNFDLEAVPTVSADDNTRGFANAAVKLIEYSDIECPFCQNYHEELLTLVEREPLANFSWTYRHFPLTQIHQDAYRYAVASECAGNQNQFWPFLDTLTNQVGNDKRLSDEDLATLASQVNVNQNQFSSCIENNETADVVTSHSSQAFDAGATGTPFSVFEFSRELSAAELEQIENWFGNGAALKLSNDRRRLAVGGAMGATQIREIVNLVVDPANNQAVNPVSEGTSE